MALFLVTMLTGMARGAWFSNAWAFRRPVKVIWDDQRGTGSEVCQVEFFTAGHVLPDGRDIRVASEDGRLVPFEVLGVGPGDVARVAFQLKKGERDYAVYFGNKDPAPVPANLPKVEFQSGLLMEVKVFTGAATGNAKEMKAAFDSAPELLGRIMIERPFIGYNPFGEQDRTIARLSGSVFAPIDGAYTFAQATDDRGALFIDGKPLVYSELGPPDTRYNGTVNLKRGRHSFVLYHVNFAGPGWLTVGWKRPDSAKFDPILRDSFGVYSTGIPGPLEEIRKTLTADFQVQYKGEYFFLDRYTHRYALTAQAPKVPATYAWDFGDGQSATGQTAEHVYLEDGVYPIRLTTTIGANSDTQTTRMMVRRDYANITNPATDTAEDQSKVVATYDVGKMPVSWLANAAQLHLRAKNLDAAARVVQRIAALDKHPAPDAAMEAMDALTAALLEAKEIERAVEPWRKVPRHSDLQPRAATTLGEMLLWRQGNAKQAADALRPFATPKGDERLRRAYAQALVLSGQVAEGTKILESLKPQGKPDRQAAVSGALARTIEFYITEKDAETAEAQWDRWQADYPTDFLEGYSVFLRVRLMAMRQNVVAAAAIAADFASAVPDSPYAARLLDFAWRSLEKIDSQRSAALHQLLKQKYPEDPLAQ